MMTLEQIASQHAAELGFDASSPQAQAAIAQGATALRSANPGVPDEELYAQNRPVIEQQIKDTAAKLGPVRQAPTAADTGYTPSTKYSDAAAAINKEFSPEARDAVKAGTKWAEVGAEAGRALSLGKRMSAGAAAQPMLDQQYAEIKAGVAQPLVDFEAKRKAKLAAMEEQIKAGTADAAQMRNELTRMGLEQAIAERKDKATIAAAEQDPNSVTSKSMRQLAMESVTDEGMKAQLQNMNAAQIKMWMPVIEKRYLKKIDGETKRLAIADKEQARADAERAKKDEQTFRAGESAKDRAARLQEANIREAGANTRAATKAGEAGKKETAGELKLVEAAKANVAASNRGLTIAAQMRNLINKGQASESGIGEMMGKGAEFVGMETERRKADEELRGYVDSMIGILAATDPRAKGAPSNKDIEGIKATISNPRTTKAEKLRAVTRLEAILNDSVKQGVEFSVGQGSAAPAPADDFDAKWARLQSGQSLVGPDGKTYTKK